MNFIIAGAAPLREFPGCGKQGGIPGGDQQPLWAAKGEPPRKRMWEIFTSLVFSRVLIRAQMQRNYLRRETPPSKRIKENSDWISHGARNSAYSHQPDQKNLKFTGHCVENSEVFLPQGWRIIIPSLNAGLVPPDKYLKPDTKEPSVSKLFPSELTVF